MRERGGVESIHGRASIRTISPWTFLPMGRVDAFGLDEMGHWQALHGARRRLYSAIKKQRPEALELANGTVKDGNVCLTHAGAFLR
jgi:hypothetical protein